MADSNTQTQDLLELELDGGADLSDLVGEVLRVGHGGGELAGLGETGTKQTRNLLDEGFGSEESIVLLGELLDELLVLVEPEDRLRHLINSLCEGLEVMYALLQVIDGHVLEVNLLSTIDVGSIGENADGHAGARDMRKPIQKAGQKSSNSILCQEELT